METPITEIRTFYSLKDIQRTVDEEIEQYESLVDEYSQWLGSFLRDFEEIYGSQEWFKKLERTLKSRARTRKGKSETGELGLSLEWIPFKNLMLCANERGEAEILFEAIEEINKKIDRMDKVKSTLEDLERSGLGKDILYITYLRDGIPEKIVLRHKKDVDFAEKFKFNIDLSA
ncbi:MAG: hypothetical protein U9O89_06750 [Thermoproteota archaeon]|nr:hypothetical protein [Thermoproteota archaeon]